MNLRRALVSLVSLVSLVPATASFVACSSSASTATKNACAGPCPGSDIRHLVLIVQENHTFDNHFGRYCTAPTGSNPTCNDGPACCEAGPATEPSGASPIVLDDGALAAYDPNHTAACEISEIDGGKMDAYVTAKTGCGSPKNFAYSDPSIVAPYWDFAAKGAIADRYFQPTAGQTSSNDMYFARAGFVFTDNAFEPDGAVGSACALAASSPKKGFPDPTIADLLRAAGVPFTFYAEGYKAMADAAAASQCAKADPGCPLGLDFYPCVFDPGDVPFDYYATTRDNPATLKDLGALDADLAGSLPAFVYVKAIGYKTEHPGYKSKLSDGVAFVKGIADKVAASKYAAETLILVTYDEGGGFFDHVAPPPTSAVDGQPYGTRVPLMAIGPFAKKNFVSHVTMEHSSIVKFVEWNWLGGVTGQLGTRDAVVQNIGSMLDPKATGTAVPE